jgi:hypothetical protein
MNINIKGINEQINKTEKKTVLKYKHKTKFHNYLTNSIQNINTNKIEIRRNNKKIYINET